MSDWPAHLAVAPIREWPGPMTRRRTRSQFSALNQDRLELLRRELRMLGAKNAELLVAIEPASSVSTGSRTRTRVRLTRA